jgi:hypothetical protein
MSERRKAPMAVFFSLTATVWLAGTTILFVAFLASERELKWDPTLWVASFVGTAIWGSLITVPVAVVAGLISAGLTVKGATPRALGLSVAVGVFSIQILVMDVVCCDRVAAIENHVLALLVAIGCGVAAVVLSRRRRWRGKRSKVI